MAAAIPAIIRGVGSVARAIGHRREAASAQKQTREDQKAHQNSNTARLNLLRSILESYGYSGLLSDKAIANLSYTPRTPTVMPSMFSTLGGMAGGLADAIPARPGPGSVVSPDTVGTSGGSDIATGAVGQAAADTASRDWWDDWEKQFGLNQ